MAFKKGNKPWNTGKKGLHLSPKTEFKKGLIPWSKGKPCLESVKKAVSKANKGRPAWNKGKKLLYSPRLWLRGKPTWNKGKTFLVGNKNPNWKGGINPLHLTIRKSVKYRQWIKNIFDRDNYQCQICGKFSDGDLNAHHIKSFTKHPELRFDLENGITLCKSCHIHIINQHEKEWESYCYFNLLTNSL